MRQLAAQGALDDRLVESSDSGVELLRRDRALADKLIENFLGNRRQRRLRREALSFPAHSCSSCYAPHTKFLTPSEPRATRPTTRDQRHATNRSEEHTSELQ